MEEFFFALCWTAYTVGTFFYIGYALTKREKLSSWGRWSLQIAVLAQMASLLMRTYFAGQMPYHGWYVPWSNWFESFSFFAAIIIIEFLIIQAKVELPILGAFVTPLAWIMMMFAVHSPSGRQIPTAPSALQSHWMAVHVPMMFLAYAAFAIAFALGFVYLIQERQVKSKKPSDLSFRLPSLDELDHLICSVISFAFPVLTLGLFLGARWAHEAWGRYWGWDAKETWALITWLVYLSYFVMRFAVGWRGRKTAYLSLVGFAVVIFTYIGVNYISTLHGFLSGGGR